MKYTTRLAAAMTLLFGVMGTVHAADPAIPDINDLIYFQGALTNLSGDPIDTSGLPMTFRITDSSGTTLFWTETHPAVAVDASGLFNVALGSVTHLPPELLQHESYLEIVIAGEVILPRSQLGSSPYAIWSRGVMGHIETQRGRLSMRPTIGDISFDTTWIEMQADSIRAAISMAFDPFAGSWRTVEFQADTSGCLFQMQSGTVAMDGPVVIDRATDHAASVFVGDLTNIRSSIELGVDSSSGTLAFNEGDADKPQIQLGVDEAGGSLNMRTLSDITFDTAWIEMVVNSSGPSLSMVLVNDIVHKAVDFDAGGVVFGHSSDGGSSYDTTLWDWRGIEFMRADGALAFLGPSGFQLSTGAASGYVLTSDALGFGTWQPAGAGGGCWLCPSDYTYLADIDDSVGIGTTTPGERLEVVGNVLVTGKGIIGSGHTSVGQYAFVAGVNNSVTDDHATVAGGTTNSAGAKFSTISGGRGNVATDSGATVGGGENNQVQHIYATISGGKNNLVTDTYGAIGGGFGNSVTDFMATIGGGRENLASSGHATVGGGIYDTASGAASVVSGGTHNVASAVHATVGGGTGNLADRFLGTVGGGEGNHANASGATVAGGRSNTATGSVAGGYSTVSGGDRNEASGDYAVVGGGRSDTASGDYSIVSGGRYNTASGNYSFAAGRRAKALHAGSFVWGDSTDTDVSSDTESQFKVRASNGVHLASDAGAAKTVAVGDRYRDNGIVAWGRVTSGGSLTNDFGVASLLRNGPGDYTVTVDVSASLSTNLIPVANAEIDTPPTSALTSRIISVNQISANTFDVYITNGNYALTDNDFVFMVTAR